LIAASLFNQASFVLNSVGTDMLDNNLKLLSLIHDPKPEETDADREEDESDNYNEQ
jgi:hypothetical protein